MNFRGPSTINEGERGGWGDWGGGEMRENFVPTLQTPQHRTKWK